MTTTGIKSTMVLLMKPFSLAGLRGMNRLASRETTKKELEAPAGAAAEGGGCWMPHPRTGIYYPKGQEWVMDDIPNDAASFDCTFWSRTIDGVDDHKPDDTLFLHNYPH